ncbi:unnamed protein product [Ixodes pacificus]
MFIQVEDTPNPNTLKFLLSCVVNEGDALEFSSAQEAQASPLASKLFEVEGVLRIFLGTDFVSITKVDAVAWEVVKPEEDVEFFDEADVDVVNQIKELIESYVRPAVAQDGGDVSFKGYREGVVFVKLRGACSGCPSAAITLKDGVYNMLSYYVPAVRAVESV